MGTLGVDGLSKTFGGLQAVKNVGFQVDSGQIHGLIGPNGSGKTTTFNLISGVITPDEGGVFVDGINLVGSRPNRVVKFGLTRTFQQIRLFPEMTATENVMVALRARKRIADSSLIRNGRSLMPSIFTERKTAERAARDLLDRVGVRDQDTVAKRLSFLDRHLTEIARALAPNPRFLLLDEPMTGMVAQEAAVLERLILGVSAEGVGVILVEHHMELVMKICQTITVLNFGSVIATGSPDQVANDPAVIEAYLGRKTDDTFEAN